MLLYRTFKFVCFCALWFGWCVIVDCAGNMTAKWLGITPQPRDWLGLIAWIIGPLPQLLFVFFAPFPDAK